MVRCRLHLHAAAPARAGTVEMVDGAWSMVLLDLVLLARCGACCPLTVSDMLNMYMCMYMWPLATDSRRSHSPHRRQGTGEAVKEARGNSSFYLHPEV